MVALEDVKKLKVQVCSARHPDPAYLPGLVRSRLAVPLQELKDELETLGLPTNGLKAELAERLEAALGGEAAADADATAGASPDAGSATGVLFVFLRLPYKPFLNGCPAMQTTPQEQMVKLLRSQLLRPQPQQSQSPKRPWSRWLRRSQPQWKPRSPLLRRCPSQPRALF